MELETYKVQICFSDEGFRVQTQVLVIRNRKKPAIAPHSTHRK